MCYKNIINVYSPINYILLLFSDLSTFIQTEITRRNIFLVSSLRWYDWINLVRELLQKLHTIHEEKVVVGDLNMESILVHQHGYFYDPSIVGFAHACYGDYSASKVLKGLVQEPLPACAHGYDDTPLPCHVCCKYKILIYHCPMKKCLTDMSIAMLLFTETVLEEQELTPNLFRPIYIKLIC